MTARYSLARRLAAEAVGTGFLLATVVGSGIMAERLSGGNEALALLCNALATGAILAVLIGIFGGVSGAHFNPAVTAAFAIRGDIAFGLAAAYVLAQAAAAVLGTWSAHLMFAEPVLQVSAKMRTGPAQWFSEAVATFGLVLAIFGTLRWKPAVVPAAVGLYITAAYWFTASTSFANPAVTLARAFTDTFSGIQPAHMPAFMVAQFAGALAAALFCAWLFAPVPEGSREETGAALRPQTE